MPKKSASQLLRKTKNVPRSSRPATKDDLVILEKDLLNMKSDIHTEIGSLREEVHTEVTTLRKEVYGEFGKVRKEMYGEFGKVRKEMYGEFGKVRKEMHAMEERLRNDSDRILNVVISIDRKLTDNISETRTLKKRFDTIEHKELPRIKQAVGLK